MSREKHDIFISHSSKDSKIAFMLCEAFEEQGVKCWIAPRDIKVGLPYANSIVEGITNSKAIVVLFSTNANKAGGVLKELEVANRRGISIIPLRIEDIFPTNAIEYYLVTNHWMDAFNPKSLGDFDEFIIEVKKTINIQELDTPIQGFISTDKSTSFRDYIIPFIVSFVLLVLLLGVVYPSLELQDVVYSFLVLAFVFSKGFIYLRSKL